MLLRSLNTKIVKIHRLFRLLTFMIIIACIAAILLSIPLGATQAFRIIFGTLYLLFIPGFLLTEVLFPENREPGPLIDQMERATLAFAFSIATSPIIIFTCWNFGINVTALSILLEISLFDMILLGVIVWRYYHFRFAKMMNLS